MGKITKVLLIVLILTFGCFSFINYSYADQNNVATNTSQNTGQLAPTVNSTISSENELFTPINVINVLLIAIGIVLILLAIAIFTRLNR